MPVNHNRVLTKRDAGLLVDLYKYRYLSVSQVQRLHFPSLQTAYRRLRALGELGSVVGFMAPGIAERLFYLTAKGAEEVAGSLGVAKTDLKWHETSRAPKDYYFLKHFLEVNDFRIALSAACRSGPLSLLGFIPEYVGQKTEGGGLAKYIRDVVCDVASRDRELSHTPDAVFALARGQAPALFFLEIDRGTEVVSDEEKGVLKAARFYFQYLVSGKYQRYGGDFGCSEFKGFRALFVTNSPARLANMREAMTRFPFDSKAKKFIWLTTKENVSGASLFDAVWVSGDAEDNNVYRIG